LAPFVATDEENALREYLCQVRVGAVAKIAPLSTELARLDREGFGARLATRLQERFPNEMQQIMAGLAVEAPLVLDVEDLSILRALAEAKPRPQTQSMIEANSKPHVSEKTIRARLKTLESRQVN